MKIYYIVLTSIIQSYQSIIPGSRLGDFPNPDFSQKLKLSNEAGHSFAEVSHYLGIVPFHVRVYATPKDGDNAGFLFEGTGACQNDGWKPSYYGGLLFAYNHESVRIWAPTVSSKNKKASVIFVGEGWGGNKYSQRSAEAEVTVEAWKAGPSPSYEKFIQINSKVNHYFEIPHPLHQVPELISVRVSSAGQSGGEGFHFHAIGAAQPASTSRTIGGVIFGYNKSLISLWTPNKPKSGCIVVGKRWGNGRLPVFSQNCNIHIRLWVNAFPPPVFQTDWNAIYSNRESSSFIEITHGLRILPTYVRVQYRVKDSKNPMIFEGTGSVQSASSSANRYGGVLFAYDKTKLRIWLPSSKKKDQVYIIFIGDGWGKKSDIMFNDTAEFRVQIFADKCDDKNEAVDAQGFCRDVREVNLVQKMGGWSDCSNECGGGIKTRKLEGYVAFKEGMGIVSGEKKFPEFPAEGEFFELVSRGKLSHPPEDLYDLLLYYYAYFKLRRQECCRKVFLEAYEDIYSDTDYEFDNIAGINWRCSNCFFKPFVKKESSQIKSNDHQKDMKK